jgi:prepilin-type processing-associated H-X9-DG protein
VTLTLPDPETMRAVLTMATQAPSMHNTQPWRWRVGPDSLSLFADPSRHLRHADPDGRGMLVSCGAALHHCTVALAAMVVMQLRRRRRLPWPRGVTAWVAIAMMFWGCISATWALEPDRAIFTGLQIMGFIALGAAGTAVAAHARESDKRRFALVAAFGIVLGLVVAGIDAATGYGFAFTAPLTDPACNRPFYYNFTDLRGFSWANGEYRTTLYNHARRPNDETMDCLAALMSTTDLATMYAGYGWRAARSRHPGGVNVATADGATHFVKDSVDSTVWKAFATRAGGETAGL